VVAQRMEDVTGLALLSELIEPDFLSAVRFWIDFFYKEYGSFFFD
jgi:hypothetical protein